MSDDELIFENSPIEQDYKIYKLIDICSQDLALPTILIITVSTLKMILIELTTSTIIQH